jgi:putative flavoprotein involved in K+ transport
VTAPILIIGAGPAGLAAAACLKQLEIDCRVIDRSGEAGGAFRDMDAEMMLASPTSLNELPGFPLGGGGGYTSAAAYLDYLRRYAAHHRISVESGEVRQVRRNDGAFEAAVDAQQIQAPFVVVATGMWSFPVMPELGKTERRIPVIHARSWRAQNAAALGELETAPPRRILIIGAGMSAIEIAEKTARLRHRVWVSVRRPIWLTRQKVLGWDVHHWVAPLERIPVWLTRRYCRDHRTLPPTDLGFSKLRASGAIEVRPTVMRVDGETVYFIDGSQIQIDLIIAATGFRFATPFLPPEVARAPGGHLLAKGGESVSWSGLFVLGHPCALRLNSEFLRGIAHDARLIAHRIQRRLLTL